ncbi:MAG: SDR family oxidoreductase [Bacteroidetes bacterium]|nr:SDR family oxidoreductase [Bacteroidota bacterium]
MKILLTGVTGYIGKRLLPALINDGHQVVCCVRDKKRFTPPESMKDKIEVIETDFLDRKSLKNIPADIDGAYYLMHSMSTSNDYESLELLSARNFTEELKRTNVKHVIYLGGIINEKTLSKHLTSRKAVEVELGKGSFNFTSLRAGIIIGSGSASFQIIMDLVEKLPVMIAPKWLNTKCQPIGIRDVISFLSGSFFNPVTYNKDFDIGGPDILSYKEMLLGYARVRGLKRKIYIVPIMTPKLSSYWLYFVTAISFKLASALVSSMKVEVVCRNNNINKLLNITPTCYEEALSRTLLKIEENQVVSSWKDAWISGRFNQNISEFLIVPSHGCLIDTRNKPAADIKKCADKIWRIGGNSGWYYANWLWIIRGHIDKLYGGVGLRRGRRSPDEISAGDAIDFWRVLYADKKEVRLLLYAEMKLPGEAWLEFKLNEGILIQTATFRPKGLLGRLYWYSVYPLHVIVFKGMLKNIAG